MIMSTHLIDFLSLSNYVFIDFKNKFVGTMEEGNNHFLDVSVNKLEDKFLFRILSYSYFRVPPVDVERSR